MNKRIAVIGIPGKWSTEVLADRLEGLTGYRLVVDLKHVVFDIGQKRLLYRGINLCELDGLVVKKITETYDRQMWDRIELLRVAQAQGVKIFSRPDSILQLVNRLGCTVTLANHDIPMPATRITESIDEAVACIEQFGQAILKPMFSTKARGMTLVYADDENLVEHIHDFHAEHPMMYVQQRAQLSGRDLGMVFIGGKYHCTYARVAQSDSWNTTIHSGGKYEAYQPTPKLIDLGERAQAPFELDFTTVDIALTSDGPIVFEVSAFGGFRGALEGCDIDAAEAYTKHIQQQFEEC